MGFRFRKSFKIAPGIKFNISKKGVGLTAGTKGAHISANTSGRKTKTVGIPGTGLSYTSTKGGSKKKMNNNTHQSRLASSNNNGSGHKWYQTTAGIIFLIIIFFPVGLYLMFKYTDWTQKTKKIVCVITGIMFIIGCLSGGSDDKSTAVVSTETSEETELSTEEFITTTAFESSATESTAETSTEEAATSTITKENDAVQESAAAVPDQAIEQKKSERGEMVWIDETANKYHSKSDCSGMDNAYQVPKEQAEQMGKTACGRCYK